MQNGIPNRKWVLATRTTKLAAAWFVICLGCSSLYAGCGDHLQFSSHSKMEALQGSSVGSPLGTFQSNSSHRGLRGKVCFSCRGATLPGGVSLPSGPDLVRYVAIFTTASDNRTADHLFQLLDLPAVFLEGCYPSILRPPIV